MHAAVSKTNAGGFRGADHMIGGQHQTTLAHHDGRPFRLFRPLLIGGPIRQQRHDGAQRSGTACGFRNRGGRGNESQRQDSRGLPDHSPGRLPESGDNRTAPGL